MKNLGTNYLIFLIMFFALDIFLRTLFLLIYEFKIAKQQKQIEKQKNTKKFRTRPFVGIVLLLNKDESLSEESLKSIYKSNYKNVHLYLVSEQNPKNYKITQRLTKKLYPKKDITVLRTTKIFSQKTVLSRIRKCGKNSQYYLSLNNGDVLEKDAIKNAIYGFILEPKLDYIIFNVKKPISYNINSIIFSLNNLLALSLLKTRGVIKKTRSTFSVGVFYKTELITKNINKYKIKYVENSIYYTNKINSLKFGFSPVFLVLWIEKILFISSLLLFIVSKDRHIFIVSWLAYIALITSILITKSNQTTRDKIKILFIAPIALISFGIFFIKEIITKFVYALHVKQFSTKLHNIFGTQ